MDKKIWFSTMKSIGKIRVFLIYKLFISIIINNQEIGYKASIVKKKKCQILSKKSTYKINLIKFNRYV